MTVSPIPFLHDPAVAHGRCETLAPGIRRVIAANPGPFTYTGTGTYIVGEGDVAVIDPGPLLDTHLDALKQALSGERVAWILITHTHSDHSPLAGPLKAWCGAPTAGFGPHGAGRPAGRVAVEEGGDRDFVPDRVLADGALIQGPGWTLEAIHTPGHTSNHLSFAFHEADALFCGDHVMGWSTTVVAPPDGDMGAYFASLDRLLARTETSLWPTHGPPIRAPERDARAFIQAFKDHRRAREDQILAALAEGPRPIPDLVARIYAHVDPGLHPAAALSVHAHLIHLVEQGRATAEPDARVDAVYAAV